MSKLSTADIQAWLVLDPEIQYLVDSRFGPEEEGDEEWNKYAAKARKDAKNPKKWVRQRKYTVGSPTDMDSCRLGEGFDFMPASKRPPDLTGGIVREFWLKDTDHVTILTVEKDGKIVFIEDLSD